MLYRIYTENKGDETAKAIAGSLDRAGITGYTLTKVLGVYKQKTEASVVIEIATPGLTLRDKVFAAAEEIRKLNKQESVLVVEIPADVTFLTVGEINGTKTGN